jgi:hypothetical protein
LPARELAKAEILGFTFLLLPWPLYVFLKYSVLGSKWHE